MKRDLPIINIKGTDFLVDVFKLELREKANEQNIIFFKNMTDVRGGYKFEYSLKCRNHPNLFEDQYVEITIPEWVVLDPVGMAKKYGLRIEEVKGKTDFEIMVDQDAFEIRVTRGVLPTINIAGSTFYVDLRMNKLRPGSNFLSKGIVFDEIDHYFLEERNTYLIPYDPEKFEFRELDYDNLLCVPKDLIFVEFPFQDRLDPIGWNRKHGYAETEDLKKIGLKSHFEAAVIPWKKTAINEVINENLKRLKPHPVKD